MLDASDVRVEGGAEARLIAELQAALADARRKVLASERLAELGTLTGGLAHEIKNPLSTVQLNLQLLAEDIDPGWPNAARVLSRLKTVQGETKRLGEILGDFLRYAGKLELDIQPVELGSMLEDLADFFEPQARLAKVRIHVRPPADAVLRVKADSRLLKQTLLNLLLNALQAMPSGGELILAAEAKDGNALVHVMDTGTGIPAETLPRIFDAYYTTKKSGTGLGLAMARRILREHGGDLTVSSEVGRGSDFTIRLPMV